MSISVKQVAFATLPMQTRFPFKYGIASMTELPHLMVYVSVEWQGEVVQGIASEGLPPKWFTKQADTTFAEDLPAFYDVIHHAADLAVEGEYANFFSWWQHLYHEQAKWALEMGHPGLLANLGVSLLERAVLDGICRASHTSLHVALQNNLLEIDLGAVHPILEGMTPRDVIASRPHKHLYIRHTIGLGDPLVRDEEELDDGLPVSLEAVIANTGCRYFKIKVCGNLGVDIPRLTRLAQILPVDSKFTIDGNEQYEDMKHFVEHIGEWRRIKEVHALLERGLLFLEQPLHRDVALERPLTQPSDVDLPAVIIDEADADLSSLPKAFELGYAGTSHKNCKGIIKGLANAALVKKHDGILSGEDLANVGPIALLQDCAMMSILGIKHVERNGHHYFRGISMWPECVQQRVLELHGDLYALSPKGFPALSIQAGKISVGSLLKAPFGCALDPTEDFVTFARSARAD